MPNPVVIGPDLPRLAAVVKEASIAWARGRVWIGRAMLLAYLAYAIWEKSGDWEAWNWFEGLTLLFHEMGHVLFRPFGEFMMIAGGSITQILVPVVAGLMLLRQGELFGAVLGGGWLSLSLYGVARYMADAEDMALPLVGFGSDPEHDWHYLLETWDAVGRCGVYAGRLGTFAGIIGLLACAYGAWLVYLMIRLKQEPPTVTGSDG
jgi:hypothetical protein